MPSEKGHQGNIVPSLRQVDITQSYPQSEITCLRFPQLTFHISLPLSGTMSFSLYLWPFHALTQRRRRVTFMNQGEYNIWPSIRRYKYHFEVNILLFFLLCHLVMFVGTTEYPCTWWHKMSLWTNRGEDGGKESFSSRTLICIKYTLKTLSL